MDRRLQSFVLVGTILSHDTVLTTVEFNLNPATNGGPAIGILQNTAIPCEIVVGKKIYVVKDENIPSKGRMVQCGYCSVTWHQMPALQAKKNIEKIRKTKTIVKEDDSPSVDSIKASDGKIYRFLGSQWAELLPSGKTGLFARRKISQELDEITGRKEQK